MTRRLKTCVEAWPECETGQYNPHCCRFPKSCSCTIYDPEISEEYLEPRGSKIANAIRHRQLLESLVGEYKDLYLKSPEFHEYIDIYVYHTELLIDRMAKACNISELDRAEKMKFLMKGT